MTTIVLMVSRDSFLRRVITCLELLDCDQTRTNLLVIVDGDNELFVKVRNLVVDMKFNERLTLQYPDRSHVGQFDVPARRRRIAALHNFAKQHIGLAQHVFSVEDDTTFGPDALTKLQRIMLDNPACAFAEGFELGRWGVPYVGAWRADDIYETTRLDSVPKQSTPLTVPLIEPIDAGGLYCALIKAEAYREHEFLADNGLGPDINFGLALRRLGYDCSIAWHIPCQHHYLKNGEAAYISPLEDSRQVTLKKQRADFWSVSY